LNFELLRLCRNVELSNFELTNLNRKTHQSKKGLFIIRKSKNQKSKIQNCAACAIIQNSKIKNQKSKLRQLAQ